MKRWALLLLTFSALPAAQLKAESFQISFQTDVSSGTVYAEEIRDRIWVDFHALASRLGATPLTRESESSWKFPEHRLVVGPKTSTYKLRPEKEKRWTRGALSRKCFFEQDRLMVPLDDVPVLTSRSFRYHLQRRRLELQRIEGLSEETRQIDVRFTRQDRTVWLSLDDLANQLGIVIYAAQSKTYKLVLPDFSILEVRVGDRVTYRRDQPYTRLADPILLFGNRPHVSVRSVPALLGTDATWNDRTGKLAISGGYGRLRQLAETLPDRLTYVGYRKKPFALRVDEASVYYQEPEPSFAVDHENIYESVRNPLTNEPYELNDSRDDRFNGQARASLEGNVAGAPLDGAVSLEKVGETTRLVNGSGSLGFPVFQVQGGREYLTFAGLSNQFNLVDQVTVSHSNDTYGTGEDDFIWKAKATRGQLDFDVFLSTAFFSETARFHQSYYLGGLSGQWKPDNRQEFGVDVQHFVFDNRVKHADASFHDEDFLREIFGDDAEITVDPVESEALVRGTLPDKHQTNLVSVNYERRELVELSGVAGTSFYDDDTGKRVIDHDWLARANLFHGKNRLDLSFEAVGDDFRSVGNPLRYKSRKIFRAAPFLHPARVWRVFGEFRREDSRALVDQGIAPSRTDYMSAVSILSLRKHTVRVSGTQFDASLYGRRLQARLDLTHHFGRDSFDWGGGPAYQWNSFGQRFRNTVTGRAGYQVLRTSWKVSLAEEYTRHEYPFFNRTGFETLTTLLAEVGGFQTHLQYERKPKYFLEDDIIYTGTVRLGHTAGRDKVFDLFYSAASLRRNLADPEVWRAGGELVIDFY